MKKFRLNLGEPIRHEKAGVRVILEKSTGGGKIRLVNTIKAIQEKIRRDLGYKRLEATWAIEG